MKELKEEQKKKGRQRRPRMEDLIPDPELRERVTRQLYGDEPLFGKGSVFSEMLQAMVNAALEGELDAHLRDNSEDKNRRNGHTDKVLRSPAGPLQIKTPRDRLGTHEPQIVGKWERELTTGLDNIILSLYAKGQSVDDIRYHLEQIYGVEISAGVITAVTNRVWEEIMRWQQRPLSRCWVLVYLDAIHFNVREDHRVISKAVYNVYGVDVEGQRDVLGMYIGESEGAHQWGQVLEDIKRRGVEDVLFFSYDGLKGFQQAIHEVYPQSITQRCIVHMIRTSVRFVSDKDRKAVCSDLRAIYQAATRDQAAVALEAFGVKWDSKYKGIKQKWEDSWDELMAFMDYREHLRRMLYTTNPIEAFHRIIRKVTKTKGAWSNEKGLQKQLYLAIIHSERSWKRNVLNWKPIQMELIELFGTRYSRWLE